MILEPAQHSRIVDASLVGNPIQYFASCRVIPYSGAFSLGHSALSHVLDIKGGESIAMFQATSANAAAAHRNSLLYTAAM